MMKKTIMDRITINEIIDCLPKERTLFRYFRGRYALMLLKNIIGAGETVNNLKKSEYAGLLDKPEVKAALAHAGQGVLTPKILDSVWSGDTYHFVLTVGVWGSNRNRRDQTTRRGYNLVLQLNFSNQHDGLYRQMVKPDSESLLNGWAHPVLKKDERSYFRETLAWSRIDLDFMTDTALIEEVQCDWLREAKWLLRDALSSRQIANKQRVWWDTDGSIDDIIIYCEKILKPYYQIWDEAMLAATIDFIRYEIGIKTIYYHTEDTGHQLKNIRHTKPPRSLYSQLPKRFCFSRTREAPGFLFSDRHFRRVYKKLPDPQWYYMAV